ncbi:putative WD repeat-containing protein [Operophtera brumata]|uniref:Putative WD repeat-containing protein n=1 Tax=Operophtera brumata TaxID=104452 RepID=A0A0L7KRZ3_OPEBR|nr:putative WD repeat-containing protein [Operophtera brumata]
MYDEEVKTLERAFYSSGIKGVTDGHTSRIFACAFNPKSHHELISGGWDDAVMCWDDRQPYATRYFFGIITCSWQEKDCIQLWDYGSCKLIETIEPDTFQSKLYCGKLVPRTNLLVCAGSDANTECCIRNNPGSIYAFDFGTVGRKSQKVQETYKKISEIQSVPRVTFVTGKRLQTVDFG